MYKKARRNIRLMIANHGVMIKELEAGQGNETMRKQVEAINMALNEIINDQTMAFVVSEMMFSTKGTKQERIMNIQETRYISEATIHRMCDAFAHITMVAAAENGALKVFGQ